MSYYRTPEHRALRARLIRRWKPWEHSTGPKTPEGKARSAIRGYKGAERDALREVARLLREQWDATERARREVLSEAGKRLVTLEEHGRVQYRKAASAHLYRRDDESRPNKSIE